MDEDSDLADLELERVFFEYRTMLKSWNPLRSIPDLDAVADHFETFLEHVTDPDRPVVLVGHSQGGIVIQRYLYRVFCRGELQSLSRICKVVLFACPNGGSPLFLNTRRFFLRSTNAQEVQLRPFNAAAAEAHVTVAQRIAAPHNAQNSTGPQKISFSVFVGSEDKVVPKVSGTGSFLGVQTIPGDHFSIIRPLEFTSLNYQVFRRAIIRAVTRERNLRLYQAKYPIEETQLLPASDFAPHESASVIRGYGRSGETLAYESVSLNYILRLALPELQSGEGYLIVVSTPSLGARIRIADRPMILGRSPDSDIYLDDFSVSRTHARITQDGNGFHIIEDLTSRNGTWLNHVELIKPTRLHTGDMVRVGGIILLYTAVSDNKIIFAEAARKIRRATS